MSLETWSTQAEIAEAKEGLAARMPGWVLPSAYGVVLVPAAQLDDDTVDFPVVNNPVHALPALVLGLVTGRRDETATYELSPSELAAAIALLTPAEAARMYNHPNLESWRAIAEAWPRDPDAHVFVVFVADMDDPSSSSYDTALRRQLAAGERSAPIEA